MPDYFKIVLPAKIVEGVNFNDLNNKDITYLVEDGTRAGKRILPDGSYHKQTKYKEESLHITPKQLVDQIRKLVKEEKFEKEKQEAFELSKRPH
jgi:hypothetical protein